MSIDINICVEQYSEKYKQWFMLKHEININPEIDNHQFFNNLAGVVGPGPKAKGFPSNVSLGTKQERDDVAFSVHHTTYYSLGEFLSIYKGVSYKKEHIASLNLRSPNLSGLEASVLRDYDEFSFIRARFAFRWNQISKKYVRNDNKYRIICWFDN